MYEYDLSGKVAVVTGGAKGLGNEYVETLALQGCDVAIIDIEAQLAEEEALRISQMTKRKIKAYYGDVGEETDVVKAVGEIVADFGRIDILVNNAGILLYGPKEEGKDPYLDYSVETWDRVMKTNITGPWLVTREVVKQSMQWLRHGKVVNIASVGGIRSTKAGCPAITPPRLASLCSPPLRRRSWRLMGFWSTPSLPAPLKTALWWPARPTPPARTTGQPTAARCTGRAGTGR